MELDTLLILGPHYHATYVPYGSSVNPQSLASALADFLPQPARVFEIESDLLTPEEGHVLARALTQSRSVLLIGCSESRLIQSLAHHWPDYCEHATSAEVNGLPAGYVEARQGPEHARVHLPADPDSGSRSSLRPGRSIPPHGC